MTSCRKSSVDLIRQKTNHELSVETDQMVALLANWIWLHKHSHHKLCDLLSGSDVLGPIALELSWSDETILKE